MADPQLQVTDSLGRRVVLLDKAIFAIGRRSTSDLRVVSTDVSRDHAEIVRIDGQLVVRDKGSRFGTFVNGEPVTERVIEHGDHIRLGSADVVELVLLTSDEHESTLIPAAESGAIDLRQMAALLDGLRALSSGRVVDEVLTLVVDLALDVTGAERGFVMLADPDGALEFKVARANGRVTLTVGMSGTSQKIPEEVFRSGRTQMVADLMDGSPGAHDDTIAFGIRHVLCAPLKVAHHADGNASEGPAHVIGVLYLDGRERSTILSRATQEALETFATEAALAIESARLYSQAAEKALLDRELQLAADIQRGLLPEPAYAGETFDLAATSIPCRTIGGDFFDYLDLPDTRLAFALGDVSGKGPPAALLATVVQSLFAAQAAAVTDPADTLTRINQGLLRRAIQARFATMFYGVVSRDGALSYSCAGHEPPVLIRRGGVESLEAGGLVLGLFAHATYDVGLVQLEPGDIVVVCSDGVTEARAPDDDEFGRERLVASVQAAHGMEPGAALERLLQAVREFTSGAAQSDDLTALVLRYRGA